MSNHTGLPLRGYLAAAAVVAPLARRHLKKRLARGKEDPVRWREKLGETAVSRPEGPLVWMHAVGVGELLALPGLVNRIRALRPEITVLLTSSSRTSAEAIARNLPAGAIHQYLPLDALPYVRAFLDHWRPDLSIWAERDVWPAFINETARRGIPLAIVNGKMSAASCRQKMRARSLYSDLYARFAFIGAQEEESARHFAAFGGAPSRIHVTGSLKSAAPPLADQPEARHALENDLAGRRVWLAASTHPGDEAAVIEAHQRLADPGICLVIAPRAPDRAGEVVETCRAAGLRAELLPEDNRLPGRADVYVVQRIGQLGLWYRVAETAFIGGSIAAVGGHNPYEAARLDCAILHGPNVWNFEEDYDAFDRAEAARLTLHAEAIAESLSDPATLAMRPRAALLAERGEAQLDQTARRLIAMMETP